MSEALDHLTVVEFGAYAAGPAVGKYLANFGARVIHVESTTRPDGFRLQYPPFKDNQVGINRSGCFGLFNDSKLGVTLDLKTERGLELARALVTKADVVIENFRPGVISRLRLGYDDLRRINEAIITLSTCNLGQTGPRASHPGFGSQLSSLSGFTNLIGESNGSPQQLYGPYIDFVAVVYGVAAVLAALDRRTRTGQGAQIDLSQYECGLQFIASALVNYAANGSIAHRNGNRDLDAVPHGCYSARDGRWCVISCWNDEEWVRLCRVLDKSEWLQDLRFSDIAGRRKNEAALNDLLAERIRTKAADSLMKELQAARVHAAVVHTVSDLFSDPQLSARQIWQGHFHPEIGIQQYRMVGYQLSQTPGSIRSAAPCLGQHNVEVFKDWLGLNEEAVASDATRQSSRRDVDEPIDKYERVSI